METDADVQYGSPDDLNIPLRVTALRPASADCLAIVFARPQGFIYQAGDWMDIRFSTKELAVGRSYSFASSPTEPDLLITFKRGASPFKRALKAVIPGDTLFITQYGNNGLRLTPACPAVFIAGGVGIALFRSMIVAIQETGAAIPMTLVYQSHSDRFSFKDELDAWRCAGDLRVAYVVTGTEGRLTPEALRPLLPTARAMQPMHYVAGPPGMVAATEQMLTAYGVAADRIRTERFTGYA